MKKIWFAILWTSLIWGLGFAQELLEKITNSNNNILKKNGENLDTMWANAITLFLKIAIALSVSFTIWAGIQYILAAGDEAKATKATKSLTFVGIGLSVAMAAYFLLQLAQQTAQSL